MLWAVMIGKILIGLVRVPEAVQMTAAAYCNLLEQVLDSWLEDITLSLLRTQVFMHEKAPTH